MSTDTDLQTELRSLDEKVDALLRLCCGLRQLNQELVEENEQLTRERDQLLDKTASARSRVELLMARLRALGYDNL